MKAALTLPALCFLFANVQADPMYVMSAEVWMRPKQGSDLLQDARLREIVLGLNAQPESRILIHYPGGEEGSLWAHELLSWLVALGVPGSRIELAPGGIRKPALGIELVTGPPAAAMEHTQ